jgi:serine/threonine protein kinase
MRYTALDCCREALFMLKLTGTGMACCSLTGQALMTAACGTPGYVAPEILEGRPYGKVSSVLHLPCSHPAGASKGRYAHLIEGVFASMTSVMDVVCVCARAERGVAFNLRPRHPPPLPARRVGGSLVFQRCSQWRQCDELLEGGGKHASFAGAVEQLEALSHVLTGRHPYKRRPFSRLLVSGVICTGVCWSCLMV